MFKEEVYNVISSEFGVSIGVASSIKTVEVSDVKAGPKTQKEIEKYEKQFRDYRREIQLHGIINRAIHSGRYKELMRTVLRDKTPNRNELTRYRMAWKSITAPLTVAPQLDNADGKPVDRHDKDKARCNP